MDIFKDDFSRRSILILFGIIVCYLYIFRFATHPWLFILLGLSVGLFSISLKQSFFNILWTVSGSALGTFILFLFSLINSFAVGLRPSTGENTDVSELSFFAADSISIWVVLAALYPLWIITTPIGYGVRKIFFRS